MSPPPPDKLFRYPCLLLNARSIVNKTLELDMLLHVHSPLLVFITETNLSADIRDSEIFPPSYPCLRVDRNRQGGGVLIAHGAHISITRIPLPQEFDQIEIVWAKMVLNGVTSIIGCCYRPPNLRPDLSSLMCRSIDFIGCNFPNHRVLLCRDFNFPRIDWVTNAARLGFSEAEYLSSLANHGFEQLVTEPTRICASTGSTLDLVISNTPSLIENITIEQGISDHKMVKFDYLTSQPLPKPNLTGSRLSYQKADFASISKQLGEDLDPTLPHLRTLSASSLWSHLKNSIITATKNFTPARKTTHRYHAPWISKQLLKQVKKKNRKYLSNKKLGHAADWVAYSILRKEVKSNLQAAYRTYIDKAAKSENSKVFYKAISKKRKDPKYIPDLTSEGLVAISDQQKADLLGTTFSSASTVEDLNTIPLLPLASPPILDNIHLTSAGVVKLLCNLDPNKAAGPDDIHPIILKNCATEIGPFLCHIISTSLVSADIPLDWRRANVTPIFKSGDKHNPTNYRPISITSHCSKIAEHVIVSNINRHLQQHNLISDSQHGFRSGHSTETQLLVTLDTWTRELEAGHTVDIIFVDFAKAFDSVPHERLLAKLWSLGIRGDTLAWIKSFLQGRQQRVVINGTASPWHLVTSGVPQGSVIGPQLFCAFVNDIPSTISTATVDALFADDLILHRTILQNDDTTFLQKDLDSLSSWSTSWQLGINEKKTLHMRLGPSNTPTIYMLNGTPITTVTEVVHLGVLIKNDLKWDGHISRVVSKADRTIGFLRRNLKGCSKLLKSKAYLSFVRPLLEYASSVWDPSYTTLVHSLEMVQRRGARFVHGVRRYDPTVSVSHLLKGLNWTSLHHRRRERRLRFFHKIVHGSSQALKRLTHRVRPLISKRRAPRCIQEHASKNVRRQAFLPRSLKDWNSLPQCLLTMDSSVSFGSESSKWLAEKELTSLFL